MRRPVYDPLKVQLVFNGKLVSVEPGVAPYDKPVEVRSWVLSAVDGVTADLEHKMFGPSEEPGMWGAKLKEKNVAEKLKVTTSTTHNLDVEGEFFTLRGSQYQLSLKARTKEPSYTPQPAFTLRTVGELDELERLVTEARKHFIAKTGDDVYHRCRRCGFWDSERDSCGCRT